MAKYKEGRYTRLGRIYHNMKTRCTNLNYDKYKWYGGKGISICDEWMNSYDVFEEWAMSHGYTDKLTLDRIDTNKNYCPENCRWVDRKTQANNRTSNRVITYNGQTKTLQEWAEITGINYNTLSNRFKAGWSADEALTKPIDTRFLATPITYNGRTMSGTAWSHLLGLSDNAVRNRLMRGWSIKDAVTTPGRIS